MVMSKMMLVVELVVVVVIVMVMKMNMMMMRKMRMKRSDTTHTTTLTRMYIVCLTNCPDPRVSIPVPQIKFATGHRSLKSARGDTCSILATF